MIYITNCINQTSEISALQNLVKTGDDKHVIETNFKNNAASYKVSDMVACTSMIRNKEKTQIAALNLNIIGKKINIKKLD